jgi:hypothetical protein
VSKVRAAARGVEEEAGALIGALIALIGETWLTPTALTG